MEKISPVYTMEFFWSIKDNIIIRESTAALNRGHIVREPGDVHSEKLDNISKPLILQIM